jgi:hypothetical protein
MDNSCVSHYQIVKLINDQFNFWGGGHFFSMEHLFPASFPLRPEGRAVAPLRLAAHGHLFFNRAFAELL